jgi:two-component system cell cycle sensor histidine kinase/response regulator CckA
MVQRIVLVVDDEPSDIALIAGTLKGGGYGVITAPDGPAAVRAHVGHAEQIDLLIADVAMAPMTGYALTDCLRAAQGDLRVLYVSGHAGAEMLQRFPPRRNTWFLGKPFTSDELLAKVSEALHAESNRVRVAGG